MLSRAFVLACMFVFLSAGLAHSFNPGSPATVLQQFDTGYNTSSLYPSYSLIKYIGPTSDNNYLVATLYFVNATKSRLTTWEITSTGTGVTVVDSLDITEDNPMWPNSLLPNSSDDDWYILCSSGNLYSFEISPDGAISDTVVDDINPGFGSSYMWGAHMLDDINVYLYGSSGDYHWRTARVEGDGTIDIMGSWDIPNGFIDEGQGIIKIGDYDNTDRQRFCWYEGSVSGGTVGKWYIGQVFGNDNDPLTDFGDVANYLVGSKTMEYGGGYTIFNFMNSTQFYDDLHLTFSYVDPTLGAGSTDDLGIEIWNYSSLTTTTAEITVTGTGYADGTLDAAPGDTFATINFDYGNVGLWYCDDNSWPTQIQHRMIWGIPLDGSITQDNISAESIVFDESGDERMSLTDTAVCRLGTSTMSAMVVTDDLYNLYIVVAGHNFPPSVTTTSLRPLDVAYNTIFDGALYAGGSVMSIGSGPITQWGFIYNTTGQPGWSDSKTVNTGTRNYRFTWDEQLLDLDTSEYYYTCFYACNESGTGYGNILQSWTFPEYPNTILHLDYEPLEISSGTISDQSGYGHDVTFTLAANPGTISITVDDIVAANPPEYSCTGTECLCFFRPTIRQSNTWVLDPSDRDYENLPGMRFINEMIDEFIPVRLFWVTGLTIIMIGAGIWCYKMSRYLLATGVLIGLVIFMGCAFHWIGWWVFAIDCFFIAGILIKSEARTPF